MVLHIVKTDPLAILPKYQTPGSAGLDLHACITERIIDHLDIDGDGEYVFKIEPYTRAVVPVGFAMQLSAGFEAQIRPRSGLALKHGVTVLNAPGTIDSDYRGEVKVILINVSGLDYLIRHGDRIAQMIIAPVVQAMVTEVEALSDTNRGAGGFGHTG